MAAAIRINELAKELGATSIELLGLCGELGIPATTARSGLSTDQARQLQDEWRARAARAADTPPQGTPAVAGALIDDRPPRSRPAGWVLAVAAVVLGAVGAVGIA